MKVQFEKHYRIPVYDTDFRGRLSLHSLFNYVQDIASEHAELLKFGREDLQRNNRFWILSRMYAAINRMPRWGEEILLHTWPRGVEGLFALREIEVTDGKGEVISAVTTSWVVVDIETRRPVRPGTMPALAGRDFITRQATGRSAGKLEPPNGQMIETPPFRVRSGDLDVNLHVNNVKYIQWYCDTFGTDYLSGHEPEEVEINFLSESVEGDTVFLRHEVAGNGNNRPGCSVIRETDGRELCRIMTAWRPAGN